jgi:Flp pilus assembly secretin CpaC
MLLALAVALSLGPAPDVIRLSPGAQQVFKYPGLKRVALTDETYADVRITGPNEIMLVGKQAGRASMTLWLPDGKVVYKTIVVDNGRGSEIARLVKEQVSPTLKVDEYAGKIIIDGTLDAVEELERLKLLVGDDPNVKLLVHMNPMVLPAVAAQITQALDKAGLRSARAVAVGNKILLEGSVADPAESQKAETIANAIYNVSVIGLSPR